MNAPVPVNSQTATMDRIRELTLRDALLKAESLPLLTERLATEAMVSPDMDFVRKVAVDFANGAAGPEKRDAARAVAGAARAFLNIIMDPTAVQVRPGAKPAVIDAEDAVLTLEPIQVQPEESWAGDFAA